MVVASVQRTWSDADLAAAVRDVLREEIIGVGHVARRGAVHVVLRYRVYRRTAP